MRLPTRAALAALAALASAATADDLFEEVAAEVGLDFVHFNGATGELYISEMLGAGAALVDVDGDGDLDVYLVQGSMLEDGQDPAEALIPPRHPPPLSDRLYRNDLDRGSLRFTDVTAESGLGAARGYGMGVAAGDFDNDGATDLYVTNLGANQLWRNRGPGAGGEIAFEDVTAAAGADDRRFSVSAAFADFDRDGWLDLYVVNYVDYRLANHRRCYSPSSAPDYCGPETYEAAGDRLLRNRGPGADGRVTFEDVTAAAGIAAVRGPGLGVVAADLDRDGWLDFYVANDGSENFLWHNRGDRAFEEVALLAGAGVNLQGLAEAGMGIDAADFDDDGDPDLFVTHLVQETNTLYANDGAGNFADVTIAAGLGSPSFPYTAFGARFLDVDNDGRLDLLVANGAVKRFPDLVRADSGNPFAQPDQLFRNAGTRFEDFSERGGPAFGIAEVSRGVAVGDVDNDGDADALVTHNGGPVRLLRNRGAGGHWLGLRLVGDSGRDLLGAEVTVHLPPGTPGPRPSLHRRAASDGSYASASDPRVLVGLGAAAEPVIAEVEWPDGRQETFGPLAVDGYATLRQGQGSSRAARLEPLPAPDLDNLAPRVAAELEQRRRLVADLVAGSPVSPELGEAFGGLGNLFQAYGFHRAATACYRNARELQPADGRWPYYLAQAYLETGAGELAVEAFEAALELRPGDVPARVWLGRTLLELGRGDEARRPLEAALELAPETALAHSLLGDAAVTRRDFATAVRHYEEALRLQPAADHVHVQLAAAYRGLGERGRAAEHLRLRGRHKLDLEDPLTAALRSLNRSPQNLAQNGYEAFRDGRFAAAAAAFREALAADPDDVGVRVSLGSALARLGDEELAATEYRQALDREPGDPRAHFNLGTLLARRGDDPAAIDHYRRALAADPGFADARLNLANALFRRRLFAASAEHYARILDRDPGAVTAARGEALALANLGRSAEALERLQAAHRAFPGDRAITDALARFLAAGPDDALRDGPRALQLAGANFDAERTLDHVETLAMAYAEVGDFEQAIAWQRRAIEVAENAGRGDVAAALEETLHSYLDGKPSRRPWRP